MKALGSLYPIYKQPCNTSSALLNARLALKPASNANNVFFSPLDNNRERLTNLKNRLVRCQNRRENRSQKLSQFEDYKLATINILESYENSVRLKVKTPSKICHTSVNKNQFSH